VNTTWTTPGREALAEAARIEQAHVCATTVPEHRSAELLLSGPDTAAAVAYRRGVLLSIAEEPARAVAPIIPLPQRRRA
jgi:hypothetical protein